MATPVKGYPVSDTIKSGFSCWNFLMSHKGAEFLCSAGTVQC